MRTLRRIAITPKRGEPAPAAIDVYVRCATATATARRGRHRRQPGAVPAVVEAWAEVYAPGPLDAESLLALARQVRRAARALRRQ